MRAPPTIGAASASGALYGKRQTALPEESKVTLTLIKNACSIWPAPIKTSCVVIVKPVVTGGGKAEVKAVDNVSTIDGPLINVRATLSPMYERAPPVVCVTTTSA